MGCLVVGSVTIMQGVNTINGLEFDVTENKPVTAHSRNRVDISLTSLVAKQPGPIISDSFPVYYQKDEVSEFCYIVH